MARLGLLYVIIVRHSHKLDIEVNQDTNFSVSVAVEAGPTGIRCFHWEPK
jgi:hypothetical protein